MPASVRCEAERRSLSWPVPGGRIIGRARVPVHGSAVRVAVLSATVLLVGCVTPDGPRALSEELPPDALAYLHPDTLRTVRIDSGIVYRYAWSPLGPWAIHLVQADLRQRCDLELDVLRAEERESGGVGRERVTSMVARFDGTVLAAVNADFFTPEGAVVGTELAEGAVTKVSERPAIAWTLGQVPWIGTPTLEDDSLHVGWSVSMANGDGITEVVGGFPELLDQGGRVGDLETSDRPSFAAARHPRTAVGYDPVNGWAWLAVIDGRQPPHSSGMTLPELTELFEALGATEALNLDGGGSSVMVVGGTAVSRPSDLTGERPVVNSLALVQSPRGCLVNDPR